MSSSSSIPSSSCERAIDDVTGNLHAGAFHVNVDLELGGSFSSENNLASATPAGNSDDGRIRLAEDALDVEAQEEGNDVPSPHRNSNPSSPSACASAGVGVAVAAAPYDSSEALPIATATVPGLELTGTTRTSSNNSSLGSEIVGDDNTPPPLPTVMLQTMLGAPPTTAASASEASMPSAQPMGPEQIDSVSPSPPVTMTDEAAIDKAGIESIEDDTGPSPPIAMTVAAMPGGCAAVNGGIGGDENSPKPERINEDDGPPPPFPAAASEAADGSPLKRSAITGAAAALLGAGLNTKTSPAQTKSMPPNPLPEAPADESTTEVVEEQETQPPELYEIIVPEAYLVADDSRQNVSLPAPVYGVPVPVWYRQKRVQIAISLVFIVVALLAIALGVTMMSSKSEPTTMIVVENSPTLAPSGGVPTLTASSSSTLAPATNSSSEEQNVSPPAVSPSSTIHTPAISSSGVEQDGLPSSSSLSSSTLAPTSNSNGAEQDVLPQAPAPVAPGIVKNGSFEGNLIAEWINYKGGYKIDQSFKHSGDQSIKVTDGGAFQEISLNAEAGSRVTIKGYSNAVGTSTRLSDYGIYADVKYADGEWLYGQVATFPGGTHDFIQAQKSFVVWKAAASMTLYAMYRNDTAEAGVAYFDGVEVTVEAPVVKNGGFEGYDRMGWSNYRGGYAVDQTFKRSGDQSIKVIDGGALQEISLNAEAGSQVTIKGYSKAVGTTVGLFDYGIYADVKYADGEWLYEQIATFPGGTHEFILAEKTFVAWKSASSMNLYAMYRDDSAAGVAYFDDIEVTVEAPVAKNGGFEGSVQANWSDCGGGYTVDRTFKRSGDQSINITDGGALQEISLNAEAGSRVTIKGYSKAVGTSTDLSDYGIYADVEYEDGEWLYGQIAKFPGGTHEFTLAEKTFVVWKTTIRMNIYAMYRDDPIGAGVAYFDDVAVTVEAPIVKNGGFEGSLVADWTNYEGGYTADQTFKRSGDQSIKMTNGGVIQLVSLDIEAGSRVTIKGYSKAVGTSTGLSEYGIFADVNYADGEWLYGQVANFPGGTHDFTLAQKTFVVWKAATGINFYAMYKDDPIAAGVAYFDDAEVTVELPVVKNGGFEGDVGADWSNYRGGYTVDQSFKRSGDQSIMVTDGGALQEISLDAEAGSRVTIKGYSKAVGTSTGLWDYGIYADVEYVDGEWLYGQIANFPGGTHDFVQAQKTFVVPLGKTAARMNLYTMYRDDGGVAYFDNVEVTIEAPATWAQ